MSPERRRLGAPRVDLLLKPKHKLRSRDRKPIERDRLTAGTVADLEWKPRLDAAFNALVPALGPTWNDTLAYAREIADDLRATTDQTEIEEQATRLHGALEALEGEVETQRRSLEVLADTLLAELPEEATRALDQLAQLTADLPPGYAEFYERAEETFGASPEALQVAMRTFARLRTLGDQAAEISAARRYLDDVTLRTTDRELTLDRSTLLAQLDLAALLERPETWDRLREDLKRFKTRYQNAYQKHHRDYYQALERLSDSLSDAPRQLRALGLLNRIEGLGAPLGDDLEERYQALQPRLEPCPVSKVTEVSVERAPTCDRCPKPLHLTDEPPEAEVGAFQRDLTNALDSKRRQLASEAISRVLARGGGDAMDTFLAAVRAADLSALVDVMNPDLADFIERLLAEEAILTADTDVLTQMSRRFPSLEESQIEEAVDEFRRLLEEAFAQARRDHPDKKTVRLNLR